jgi:Uncharacterized protein conserved in bacteria (DUF2252)
MAADTSSSGELIAADSGMREPPFASAWRRAPDGRPAACPRADGPDAGARVESRPVGTSGGPPGPGGAAGEAGGQPGTPTGPDPARADAGLAVAFYRGAALIMAADLAGTPVSGVTVQPCGDAYLQFRPVRHARTADDLRSQRLRRDPARSMGVGRQADGGQLRGNGPRAWLQSGRPARHRDGWGRRIPGPDAPGRRNGSAGRMV